jgi:isochorismate synthase
MTPDAWYAAVSRVLAAIERGEVEKVVLARRLIARAPGMIDVPAVLARLRERFADCTLFAFDHAGGVFLGATPERLVRVDGGQVSIDCLAGSIRRGDTSAEDTALGNALLADAKERHEHAVVRQVLLEQIDGICDEITAPEAPGLRRFQNIQHLFTPLRATAREGHDVLDFVERLHPTPATGGRPRERALELLRECEGFDRGWFAGPVGWLNAEGGGEFVVGIRSAYATASEVSVAAGCGIVAGSDPERELAESRLKMRAMLWALTGE